ncbi:hypothetical protein Anapl_03613 [Anas platyrhynchos]|uniref:Uncharacterized protein n=1 Tax=Anas platyrhynchos TaxID=8839 RepID=R0M027_ANAPL|nr:hypothetical protein Anapl_03613 [Anas platyrhynchos]
MGAAAAFQASDRSQAGREWLGCRFPEESAQMKCSQLWQQLRAVKAEAGLLEPTAQRVLVLASAVAPRGCAAGPLPGPICALLRRLPGLSLLCTGPEMHPNRCQEQRGPRIEKSKGNCGLFANSLLVLFHRGRVKLQVSECRRSCRLLCELAVLQSSEPKILVGSSGPALAMAVGSTLCPRLAASPCGGYAGGYKGRALGQPFLLLSFHLPRAVRAKLSGLALFKPNLPVTAAPRAGRTANLAAVGLGAAMEGSVGVRVDPRARVGCQALTHLLSLRAKRAACQKHGNQQGSVLVVNPSVATGAFGGRGSKPVAVLRAVAWVWDINSALSAAMKASSTVVDHKELLLSRRYFLPSLFLSAAPLWGITTAAEVTVGTAFCNTSKLSVLGAVKQPVLTPCCIKHLLRQLKPRKLRRYGQRSAVLTPSSSSGRRSVGIPKRTPVFLCVCLLGWAPFDALCSSVSRGERQGREQPRNPRGMKLLPLGQELQYLAAGEARSAIWGCSLLVSEGGGVYDKGKKKMKLLVMLCRVLFVNHNVKREPLIWVAQWHMRAAVDLAVSLGIWGGGHVLMGTGFRICAALNVGDFPKFWLCQKDGCSPGALQIQVLLGSSVQDHFELLGLSARRADLQADVRRQPSRRVFWGWLHKPGPAHVFAVKKLTSAGPGGFSYCETRVLWTGAFARRKPRALLPSVPKAAPSVWDLLPILTGSALPCCKLMRLATEHARAGIHRKAELNQLKALPTVRICYLDFHCKAELSSLLSLPYCSATGSMNRFHEGGDAGWSSSLMSVPYELILSEAGVVLNSSFKVIAISMLFHSSCFQSRGLRQGGAYPALSWELQVPVPAAAFCAGGGLAVVSFPLRYRLCQWRGAVNENTEDAVKNSSYCFKYRSDRSMGEISQAKEVLVGSTQAAWRSGQGQIFTRGRAISCLGIAIWYFVGTLSLHYTKLLGIGRAPLAGWICWGDVSVPSCTRRAGKVADARRKLVKKITTGIGFALAACQDITWAAFASLPILLPAPVVEVRHRDAAGAASKLFALQGFPWEGVSIARGHRLLSSNPLGDEVAGGEQSSKITQRAEGAASPRILPCDVCEVCCGQV